MKRTSSPTSIVNENEPKKLKITNDLKQDEIEDFKNIEDVHSNRDILNLCDLIYKREMESDPKKIQKINEKINQHSITKILCALLFQDVDDMEFSKKFSKCVIELMKDTGMMEIEDFLMDGYDYECAAHDDFSFEYFTNDLVKEKKHFDIAGIIGKQNLNDVKQKLTNLVNMWLKEDVKLLSVCYSNYFERFVHVFQSLGIESSDIFKEMHDQCLIEILSEIQSIDERRAHYKYSIYEEIENYESDDEDDEDEDSVDPRTQFDVRTQQTKSDIHHEVCGWQGEYPFSGLINGRDTVEEMFQKTKNL